RERLAGILADLERGARLALISDAGTPLVSDPGFPLVRAARAAGLPVFAVPGPSAVIAALAVAGLPTNAFTFAGFLPARAGQRAATLQRLASHSETLVFYESPRRLGESLAAMAQAFGTDREAAVVLELTKRFERVKRGPLGALAAALAGEAEKGEAVIVVAGADVSGVDPAAWRAALAAALARAPLRAAVEEVTEAYGLKRKDVYDAALALKAEKP
ncbi:MAG TPA: 16S rRNA (cytidine(1402)-2'-O)-methyltransferase, partial [Alphaproteobacteria bacterium]|nr:16S rRNA (cytidine(1402)-2'-O)-methyltransferase [Alphaproteobacteria bacterium]